MVRVVVLSDTHVGSVIGLWPGKHAIQGGGDYEVNQFQRWLWNCWQAATEEIRDLRPDALVLNGDVIQGSNRRDGELVTDRIDIQVRAAYDVLHPLVECAGRTYLIRGTEWHEGRASEWVEALGERLDTVRDPGSQQWSWPELYLDMGGPVAHFGHHIGMSSVSHYEATTPLRELLMLLAELMRFFGTQAPNVRVAARSHRHRFVAVEVPYDLHGFVTPGWQLKTAFGFAKTLAMLPQIGFVRIEYDGDDIEVKDRTFKLPELHVENLLHVEEVQ